MKWSYIGIALLVALSIAYGVGQMSSASKQDSVQSSSVVVADDADRRNSDQITPPKSHAEAISTKQSTDTVMISSAVNSSIEAKKVEVDPASALAPPTPPEAVMNAGKPTPPAPPSEQKQLTPEQAVEKHKRMLEVAARGFDTAAQVGKIAQNFFAVPGKSCPGGSVLYKGPETKEAAADGFVYCVLFRKVFVLPKDLHPDGCPRTMHAYVDPQFKPDSDVIWCKAGSDANGPEGESNASSKVIKNIIRGKGQDNGR